MHFYEMIKKLTENKKTIICVDMDGVISSYNFNKPLDFKTKRPLTTNIKTLSEVSKLENVELHILSICKLDYQIDEKNNWLDKYAPFFDKDKRMIISKENTVKSSKELKLDYLKTIETEQLVLIDDDNEILKYINNNLENIVLYQDSELID